jgi:hypothetical protein
MKSLANIKKSSQKLRDQNHVVEMPAFLGNLKGVVKADNNGNVNVVLFNGTEMVVRNDKAPLEKGLPVVVGYDKSDSTFRVLKMRKAYHNPPYVELPAHAEKNHQWPNLDTLWVRPEQILSGIAIPESGMVVQFVGFVYYLNGFHLLNTQSIDLTTEIPASGANYVLVQADEDQVISFETGASKASREVLEYEDIPEPAAGNKPLFAVKMYLGQTRIIKENFDTDIIDLRWAGHSIGGGGASSLDELSDVNSSLSPTDRALLVFDEANDYWDADNDLLNTWDNGNSAGRLWGGILTDAGSGKVDISAGAGLVKNKGGQPAATLEDEPTAITDGQGGVTSIVAWDAQTDFALAGVGYNLIYWDASAAAFAVQLKADFYANFDFITDFTIGRVYYDGTTVTIRLCGMNKWNFARRVQMFGEEVFPVVRATGLLLSGTGTRNIAITDGRVWAELVNPFTVTGLDTSVTGSFTAWYRDGSGGWTAQATQTQINNTQYDDGDGALGTLTANRYGVHWVYSVHDSTHHVVFGQGDYTLAQAELAQPPATLPGLLSAYATLIGKIIIKKSAATFTSVQSAFSTTFTPTDVTEHNDLSGIQGGATDDYYHLTAAQASGLTDAGNADDLHTHEGADGWRTGTGAWSYSSADAPTFVISVNNDQTGIISVGMRIKLTQTTAKYFIVTAVGAYSGGATLITVYGGTDYTLANAAITTPYWSNVKVPFGFPISRAKWTVSLTDTTTRFQTSPTANTWYSPGSLSISIPIGLWDVAAQIALGSSSSGAYVYCSTFFVLSEANNASTNGICECYFYVNSIIAIGQVGKTELLSRTTKQTYYPILKTDVPSVTALYFFNERSKMIIEAVCAYL